MIQLQGDFFSIPKQSRNLHHLLILNPVALRKAKIVCNFGLSECNRDNEPITAAADDSHEFFTLFFRENKT